MDLDGVRALRVPDVLLPEALLLLWAPWVMVLSGAAVSVADAWGFQPKTVVPWVKGRLDVDGLRVQIGMGNYVRCCTEALLVCTRGGLRVPPADRPAGVLPLRSGPESLGILAPRGRHSEKPELARDLAEALSDGPYLELFARTLRPGWSAWGNEAPVPDPRLVGLL
jgi:N6-adenosine-specific RNA methylase IME4